MQLKRFGNIYGPTKEQISLKEAGIFLSLKS